MRGVDDALADRGQHRHLHPRFPLQIDVQLPTDEAMRPLQVLAAAERILRLLDVRADQEHVVAIVLQRRRAVSRDVIQETEHPDHRRRVHGAAAGLVVKRDVPGNDRCAKRSAGVGDAVDHRLHLEVHIRALRVAEVQAVSDSDRGCADANNVARRLSDGDRTAAVGVDVAVAAVPIGGDGEPAWRALDSHNRCISACFDDGVGEDTLVVLSVDEPLAGDIRRGQQVQQRRLRIDNINQCRQIELFHLEQFGGRHTLSRVFRRIDKHLHWKRGHFLVAVEDVHELVVGHLTDDR